MKKKPLDIQDIFDKMPTRVSLMWHDKGFQKRPKTMLKMMEKNLGFRPEPSLYHPICIQWSEKGRGFGEYVFWQEDSQIYCDSECDSKETVKRILCQMVDQAILR